MTDYQIINGDCLEVMASMPNASVDAVITDPPYGTTACKWDSVIPFEPMWTELKRIAKPKAAICLFGSQPFTSALVMSNPKMFRYELIWQKERPSAPGVAAFRPLPIHEQVLVFGESGGEYNPIMDVGVPYRVRSSAGGREHGFGFTGKPFDRINHGERFPVSVLAFRTQRNNVHPTQKPVELLRYLIRTYTLAGETVLDFTMGSGSTGVACQLEGRLFIGIEKDEAYFEMAKKRIAETEVQEPLFGPVSVTLEQGSLI